MKLRIALTILLISVVALACGLFAACVGETHVHDYKLITAQSEPTCTEDGWGLYRCDCGEEKEEEIPALDHDWGEWTPVTAATCNEKGVTVRICKRDVSHIEDLTTPALGHDWKVDDSRQPTCTENGYELLVCRTDSTHTERRTLSATGHTYSKWKTVVEPGCLTVGAEEQVCENCSDTQSRIIPGLGHNYKNGVCTRCGRDLTGLYKYSSDYGYLHLSLDETNLLKMQELYKLIDADASKYHNGEGDSEILGTYGYAELGLTFEEATTVWKTYMDDHPLYYWLGRTLYYGETLTVPVDSDYTNPEIRAEYNNIIYETAEMWRNAADDNAYLAALSYHDKIIYAIDYAYLADGRTPQTASWAHNIVGVFTGQGAVCEGYARTFQLMLNMTGIQNVFVTGKSQESAHAWNLAKLDDGQWYWFDLTYDDVPDWLWGVQYNYFAVSETQNVNWRDSDAEYGSTKTFSDLHTPDSGTGVKYMPALPERSETDYRGAGELLLRRTFSVGKFTYALVGYRAVQVINCTSAGEVYIPESVTYKGTSYEVISVGSMKENGLFGSIGDNVFHGVLTTLHIPSTVRYLFETGIPDGYYQNYGSSVRAFDVDENNQYFTSVDGVLFTKSMYTLISYPGGSSRKEYYIPDNVVNLASKAFTHNSRNLRSLTIGSGLVNAGNLNWGKGWMQEAIPGKIYDFADSWYSLIFCLADLEEIKVSEDNAYYSAENGMLFNKDKTQLITVLYGLTEAVVPPTVTVVKASAFFYSSNLTRLVFEGDALQSVAYAFANNHYLDEIVFGGTREQWDAVNKGSYNAGYAWDDLIGRNTPDGTYTLTCLGDL